MSPEQARFYLAALIDGEGCIGNYAWRGRRGTSVRRRVMLISVTDVELIDAAAECLDALGVRYRRFNKKAGAAHHKPIFGVEVTNFDGLKVLAERVPIRHLAKREKLAQAVATFRAQACLACGCAWDRRTSGCLRCTERHKARRRQERSGRGTKVSVSGRTGRPRRAVSALEADQTLRT